MGRKAGLTREEVLAAAIKVADRRGLPATTLAAVAHQLGIQTPSLYHYFDGTDGLRRALSIAGCERLSLAMRGVQGKTPTARLLGIARAYRTFAHAHPGLHAAFLPAPRPGEDEALAQALAEPVQVVGESLRALGVPARELIPSVRALRSFLFGFVTLEQQGGFGLPDDIDASFEDGARKIIQGITEGKAR